MGDTSALESDNDHINQRSHSVDLPPDAPKQAIYSRFPSSQKEIGPIPDLCCPQKANWTLHPTAKSHPPPQHILIADTGGQPEPGGPLSQHPLVPPKHNTPGQLTRVNLCRMHEPAQADAQNSCISKPSHWPNQKMGRNFKAHSICPI